MAISASLIIILSPGLGLLGIIIYDFIFAQPLLAKLQPAGHRRLRRAQTMPMPALRKEMKRGRNARLPQCPVVGDCSGN